MNISDMLPTIDAIKESLADPQRLHALVVHLPIGITLIGMLLTLGVIVTGSKVPGLRWTTVFIYLVGTLAALWTVQTGEEAEHALATKLTGAAHEVLEKHEALAEFFWIGLAATAVFIMVSGIRISWLKTITLILALVTSLGSVAWVGAIGHHGGDMVYTHSVGVPSSGPSKSADDDNPPSSKDSATKDDTKDAAAKDETKDAVKDAATKDDAKDTTKDATKDAAPKDERKLPDVSKKDKSIFD